MTRATRQNARSTIIDLARVPSDILGTRSGLYNTQTNIYNLKASNMRRANANLGKVLAGTGSFRIAAVGHSILAGTGGVPGISDSVSLLGSILNGRGYPTQEVFVTGYKGGLVDTRWSFPTGWNLTAAGSCAMSNNTNSNPATLSSTTVGTVVMLRYYGNGASFTVSIDGAAAVQVDTVSDLVTHVYSVTGLANTTHTVTIVRVSGSSIIMGASVSTPSVGVRLFNLGIAGQLAGAVANTLGFATAPFAATIGADLTIMEIIANDAYTTLDPTYIANWKNQVQTGINSVSASGSNILLVADNPFNTQLQTGYRTALYELADANDLPILDMYDRWSSYGIINALGNMFDVTHPNGGGYGDQAHGYLGALSVA